MDGYGPSEDHKGRRRSDASRAPNGVGVAEHKSHMARLRRVHPTSMGSVAVMKAMKAFMIEMMNPLPRDHAAVITLVDSLKRCLTCKTVRG
jgi:hypothetical protein